MPRPRFLSFSTREQILFAKRIAMMLRAGVPLFETITLLQAQAQARPERYVYAHLLAQLERGGEFSRAMESLRLFDRFAVSMVRVGESSGSLYENLRYVAEELRRAQTVRRKMIGALVYPAVVAVATVGMALAITLYIFPKIAPVFRSFKHALPLSTRIVMGFSQFLMHDWLWAIAAIALCGALVWVLMRSEQTRPSIERLILNIPLVGGFVRTYQLAMLSRTAGLLLSGGMQIVETLEITAESSGNVQYRKALQGAAQALARGTPLTKLLEADALLFPKLFTQMIAVGERTGDLSGALLYIAEVYEGELTEQTARMTELLEPVLMIAMGVVVGFLAIAIITPIYGITQDLSSYH